MGRRDSRSKLTAALYGVTDQTIRPAPGVPGASITTQLPDDFTAAVNRTDDGKRLYKFDEKGRLTTLTEEPASTATPIRRLHYYYNPDNRVIGRRAEYATPTSLTADPDTFTWKREDRAGVLANEGLPADVTFAWDAISDTLIEVWKAGSASTTDANGGLLKQTIHGALAYDDPIETTFPNPGMPTTLTRLYPIFDEAGTGSLQSVLNAEGQLVARNVPGDAFDATDTDLAAAAVDQVSIKASKNESGTLDSVDITLHSTESITPTTLPTGVRLTTLTSTGAVAATFPTPATLLDPTPPDSR